MSGGFVAPQKAGEHQVVIFTFIGEMTPAQIAEWNQAIKDLKRKFAPNLIGVTI